MRKPRKALDAQTIARIKSSDYKRTAIVVKQPFLPGGQRMVLDGVFTQVQTLRHRFVVPPFSVLDSRQEYWRRRRKAWLDLGIESEKGRERNLLNFSEEMVAVMGDAGQGTGVFDPLLCEVFYRWFCPPGGLVLDPFAGGSVRGLVAGVLGRRYVGVDLRPEQVQENRRQLERLSGRFDLSGVSWTVGDSRDLLRLVPRGACADFLFTSPPYFGRERYSSLAKDLNNSTDYAAFLAAYRDIVAASVGLLRRDRFACFEVAQSRGKDGQVLDLVTDTILAFCGAGAELHNHIIHLKPVGTARIRASRSFLSARRVCPIHEHDLVFVKGDPKKASQSVGDVEFGECL